MTGWRFHLQFGNRWRAVLGVLLTGLRCLPLLPWRRPRFALHALLQACAASWRGSVAPPVDEHLPIWCIGDDWSPAPSALDWASWELGHRVPEVPAYLMHLLPPRSPGGSNGDGGGMQPITPGSGPAMRPPLPPLVTRRQS